MRASVTEARVTVYVCVHMPRECVCEGKDVHAYCSKKLAAQQRHHFSTQANHFVCRAEYKAKMASIEFRTPKRNALGPRSSNCSCSAKKGIRRRHYVSVSKGGVK